MKHEDPSVIVLDTSVLVNFLRIERMDLIKEHSHNFVITDDVADEITDYYPAQRDLLEKACRMNIIQRKSITDPVEFELFGKLSESGKLGMGERSAIAFAVYRGHTLAIDDRRASNQGKRISQTLRVLTTQDLVVSMIHENLLDVSEADTIKDTWRDRHNFTLAIQSFSDPLS